MKTDILALLVFFMMGFNLCIPVIQKKFEIYSAPVKADPLGDRSFNNTEYLGYELLENNSILHMWNTQNDYYFNTSSGIQFSNHYEEYWTRNVLMLGYYDGDAWNLIYRTDELSGFDRNLSGETDNYLNATLWKDLSYGSYDFRLAIRYHLGVNDSDLMVIPYIKNLGIAIPFQIGFGWEMKDIKIANVTNDNYLRIYNGTDFEDILLNQTLDRNFTDMDLNTTIRLICTNPPSPFFSRDLYLSWNPNLTYKVTCKSRANQYNAPVTLFIKVGTLAVDQEKSTEMHWLDADDWLGISSTELDSFCGEDGAEQNLADALDGVGLWAHTLEHTHWFVIDLGSTHTIKKLRGRSLTVRDPIDIDVYCDDNNPPSTLMWIGITTWQDTDNWVEIDVTDRDGRYIKVEIWHTENPSDWIYWGDPKAPFTIFDAYGDVAGPSNTAPTQSGEVPANSSTGISLTPDLYVNCSDTDGDNLNATWWSNSSGSWVQFASNWTSFASGTNITQNFPNASAYSTTYWWSVNLSDGTDWTNETYYFTTNYLPTITNPYPSNGSTDIPRNPNLNITVNDPNGDTMNITWYTNATYNITMGPTSLINTTDEWDAVRMPYQKKVIYANNTWWVFYANGSGNGHIHLKTSSDGETWTYRGKVIEDCVEWGAGFDTYLNGTDEIHICWVYDDNQDSSHDEIYRRGTLQSNGVINWHTSEQQIMTTNPNGDPSICVNKTGYPFVGYIDDSFYPYVHASEWNNGSWSNAFGFPIKLANRDGYWIKLVSLSNGNIYAIYWRGDKNLGNVYGKLWNGTDWSNEETVAINKVYSLVDYGGLDAVSIGNDVHIVFVNQSEKRFYHCKRTFSSGWGTLDIVADSNDNIEQHSQPSISKINDKIFVFYGNANTDYLYYINSSDDSTNPNWNDGQELTQVDWYLSRGACHSCAQEAQNNMIGILWTNKSVVYPVGYYTKFTYLNFSWTKLGENTSIGNGIYEISTTCFNDYNTKYYWNVSVNDGTCINTSDTYHFTTVVAKEWVTLDTWNITLGNMSIAPYILDTWNLTLGNLTIIPFTIDTWNLTLGNLTISPFIIDKWNITLGNLTTTPFTIDTWNLTLSNTIQPYTLDKWNLTIGNLTISPHTLDKWNITLSNLTISPYILDTWNITLGNLTISQFTIDQWNLTLSNTPQFYTLDQWNLTLGNLTISSYVLDKWNITLSNIVECEILDTWNITLGNLTITSFIIDVWNLTLSNTTEDENIVNITSITPLNTSIGENISIVLNCTKNGVPVQNISIENISIDSIPCSITQKNYMVNYTVTLDYNYVTDDAYVDHYFNPDTNYGTATTLRHVKGGVVYSWDSNRYTKRVYIAFNISTLPTWSNLSQARVYLHLYDVEIAARTCYISQFYNTTWDENTITWNTQSYIDLQDEGLSDEFEYNWTALDGKYVTSSDEGKNISFNVTSAIEYCQDNNIDVVSFLLTDDHDSSSGSVKWYSKEGTYKPYMDVDYYNLTDDIEYNAGTELWTVNCTINETISNGLKDIYVQVNFTDDSQSVNDTETNAITINQSEPFWRNQGQEHDEIMNTETNALWVEGLDFINLKSVTLSTNETGEWENKTLSLPLWKRNYTYKLDSFSTCVYEDDVIYTNGEYFPFTFAINASTGRLIWSAETGVCDGSPAIDSDMIYTAGNKQSTGFAYGIYKSNGTIKWQTDLDNATLSSAVTNDEFVYLAEGGIYGGSGISCLYKTNGTIKWEDNRGGRAVSPAIYGDMVITAKDDDMYAFNASTGELIWQCTISNQWDSSPVIADDMVFIGGSTVTAHYVSNGTSIWSESISTFSTIAYYNNTIYFGSRNGYVYALWAENGTQRWKTDQLDDYELGQSFYSSPSISNGKVFIGARNGTFYVLNVDSGDTIWSYNLSQYINGEYYQIFGSPSIAEGKVFILADSYLFCFQLGEGEPDIWSTFCHNATHGGYSENGITLFGIFESPQHLNIANDWVNVSFTWYNSSFSGTLGWKAYLEDYSDNINVTDVMSFTVKTKEWVTLDTWNLTLGNMSIFPCTLDTWNLTLGNLTISPCILDKWNLTLSNTIQSYILDRWNITLSNLTISSYILDTWNITLSNTPEADILDTWNLTLGNTTISQFTIDAWNITLSNLSISVYALDIWNITLSNITLSYTLDKWNVTLSNTPESHTLDRWNITIGNLTVYPYTLDTWNIILSNTTQSHILDRWNLTLSNLTISSYTLDKWNITLSNTTGGIILDTWNITLGNLTITPFTLDQWNITLGNLTISSYTVDIWNITISNTTQPYVLDRWNITIANLTISPFTIDTWNVTLSNTSAGEILDIWNLTIGNMTISPYTIDTWNITIGNLTVAWITLDVWNLTLSNTAEENILDTWNLTLSNSTELYTLDIWNVTLGNLTISYYVLDIWNITLSSDAELCQLDLWNLTLSNYSIAEILDIWNLTLSNTSIGIFFDNEDPSNESTNVDLDLIWQIDISNTEGNFNWSINCSNGQSNNATDDSDGRKNVTLTGLEYNTGYIIWVNVTDAVNSENAWYIFTTIATMSADFTYIIEGINIHCTSISIGNIDEYKWEIAINGVHEGTTGWINDSSGRTHTFTYPDGGIFRITHCIRSEDITDCITKGIGEIPPHKDKYPAENYGTCKSCEDAGYYWYDDIEDEEEEKTCHEQPKQPEWNDTKDVEDLDEAGKHDEGKVKIGDLEIDVGWIAIPVILGLFFIVFVKTKKKKE